MLRQPPRGVPLVGRRTPAPRPKDFGRQWRVEALSFPVCHRAAASSAPPPSGPLGLAARAAAAAAAASALARRRCLPAATRRRASAPASQPPVRPEGRATAPPGGPAAASVEDILRGDEVTFSRFCHGWSIAQLAGGYRYCFDDVLCAHLALAAAPGAARLLDLGSGLGTVGLLWLGQQPRPLAAASCTLLEAQAVSVELCRRTLRRCGLEEAVDLRHGDLRDDSTLEALGGGFDVVTANPPYMSAGIGALPRHPQRAFCRHELRGGLPEFCRAAAGQLAPGGTFCVIHAAVRAAEVSDSLAACDLVVQRRADVFARGMLKSVAFVCSKLGGARDAATAGGSGGQSTLEVEVQAADGSWTPQWMDICRSLGL